MLFLNVFKCLDHPFLYINIPSKYSTMFIKYKWCHNSFLNIILSLHCIASSSFTVECWIRCIKKWVQFSPKQMILYYLLRWFMNVLRQFGNSNGHSITSRIKVSCVWLCYTVIISHLCAFTPLSVSDVYVCNGYG